MHIFWKFGFATRGGTMLQSQKTVFRGRPSVCQLPVRGIFPTLLKLESPNLVHMCILERRIFACYFFNLWPWPLTLILVKYCQKHIFRSILAGMSKFHASMHFGTMERCVLFKAINDLDLDLWAWKLVKKQMLTIKIAYFTLF